MKDLFKSPQARAWLALWRHQQQMARVHMRDLFEADPGRFERFSLECGPIFLDYSKNRITDDTLRLLTELAENVNLADWMLRMRRGDHINVSENRAVLHTALRHRDDSSILVDGVDVMPEVRAVLQRMRVFAESVRHGEWLGHTGQRITDIVNIGIGGSDLGPMLVARALRPYGSVGIRTHFVSNVDGGHLSETLVKLDPATTLFVVTSKSFTTPETLLNATSARDWLVRRLGNPSAVAKHFVAVSTNSQAVTEFGIDPQHMFEFWDWVGGRYSLWSAVGLTVAIQIGMDHFEAMLQGAYEMDQHFFSQPFERNIPVILALLGIWYNTCFGAHTHAVIPYDQSLSRLPAHLQQLDMESNGKRVTRDGFTLDFDTGPIIWGEAGVNCQHAFFQLLHQGTRLIPSDFILPMKTLYPLGNHHDILTANCLAQTQALMRGKSEQEARQELEAQGLSGDALAQLLPHKVFPGNQPSNTIMLDKVTPHSLGSLIAMYEHKVFVQGVIWGLNSFDQWGVEYGKQLAQRIIPQLADDSGLAEHDASTSGLIARYRRLGHGR
ncbi:glucose-6-phosphate isomerase [Chitinivorax sp. B]|uniref:glucose-6-phosphate isomerase n=1 Tax=Chitinivorax sp. B TaxID=2502235 RepID=UPI0010F9E382|nr:glucose-6-phosphate isomerase [Chitinivorax sp. B]